MANWSRSVLNVDIGVYAGVKITQKRPHAIPWLIDRALMGSRVNISRFPESTSARARDNLRPSSQLITNNTTAHTTSTTPAYRPILSSLAAPCPHLRFRSTAAQPLNCFKLHLPTSVPGIQTTHPSSSRRDGRDFYSHH